MESERNDLEKSDDNSKLVEVVESTEVIGFLLPNINSVVEDQSLTSVNHISGSLSTNEVNVDIQSETLQLVDESNTYIETITDQLDGQNVTVQLIDGSTAFIRTSQKDGIQTVQLQDGTTAYISHTLDLEEFASGVLDTVPNEDLTCIPLEKQTKSAGGDGTRVTKAFTLGEKAFRCEYEGCDRLYTTQHHLRVHERTHTGIRPFKCAACKKEFATGYSLKSHTRVHTGEKPYKCTDYCGKAFKTSGDLQKHLRTHTGERPFKCPYNGCDRSFTTSNIRKVHMRIHTGERPYVCPVDNCDRTFASATNYKNHLRIHTGEKPYVCVVKGCGKKFTEYSSLYKHNVVHTPAKPYVCDLCGRNYRQTSTLSMHRRSAHGITDVADLGDHIVLAPQAEDVDLPSESDDNHQPQDEKCQRIQVMVVDSNGESQTLQLSKDTSEHTLEQGVQLQLSGEHSGTISEI